MVRGSNLLNLFRQLINYFRWVPFGLMIVPKTLTLREKCPNTEFFWSVFSRIHTEKRKIQTRKNSAFGRFSFNVTSSSENIDVWGVLIMLSSVYHHCWEFYLKNGSFPPSFNFFFPEVYEKKQETFLFFK